jgi:hypothetical protein
VGSERSRSSGGRRFAATSLLLCALILLGPRTALAAHHPPDANGTAQPANVKKHKEKPAAEGKAKPQLTDPSTSSPSNLAKELESKGQVDPVAGLGIRNPVCDALGQIRDRSTRLSCEANGTPESDYPTSNYGFDVFIATGVTHPIGDFTAAFVTILNGVWLGLIFVLKLILELLGLAFGLNPFAEGRTMGRISTSLSRLYAEVTDPWLSTLVVCGGIWFAHRGLIRRDLSGSLGGTVAAIAMIVLGLWVVHQPRESVGRLASLSDQVALGIISAPQSGSVDRPVGSYAEAMSETWSRLVEVPFAGLDFSDVHWALGRPPPEAVERADRWFCQDTGALSSIAAYAALGSADALKQCAAIARKRYGRPRRIIDLYLRSSTGSPAREALWRYFDGSDEYKAKIAAQGGDGALTRLSMLALFAIGLLGSILLLAWLAIRLFTQAAIAFVLLLAAPFALFFPLLGDAGRSAFRTWGLTLLGSLLAKVIYAAFLSIVLLGISVLGTTTSPGGSATGFLLTSAFTWAVFLKRSELVGWLSIGEHHRHSALPIGGIAAYSFARRATRAPARPTVALARRATTGGRERLALGRAATTATATGSLRQSARALADRRYTEARRTIERYESARGSGGGPPAQPTEARAPSLASAQAPSRSRSAPQTPSRVEYQAARDLVAGADRNRARGGVRWRPEDLDRFAAEDRRLLKSSSDPGDHAHRAGIDRASFEQLRGPERERVERQIETARERDRKRLALAAEPSRGALRRGRVVAERARQVREGAGADRRAQLKTLRRQRRAADHLHPRRNLSRGS